MPGLLQASGMMDENLGAREDRVKLAAGPPSTHGARADPAVAKLLDADRAPLAASDLCREK
jgi:hypothetical protein